MKSVGIVGAGVAGLTVAHELLERGFAVTLYEAESFPGGKAGSGRTPDGLVREHVNKNFSAHYYCLPETLKRIPCGDGTTVFDRLVSSSTATCRFPDGSEVAISGRMGMTRKERSAEGRRFIRAFAAQGLPKRDTLAFVAKHARLLFMSPARRERELGGISYADYLGVERRSPALRYLVQLIEISAAANPEGPALAAAEQTLRVFGRFFNPHGSASMINMLDGPSRERMFEPWVAHLRGLGATLHCEASVEAIVVDGDRRGVQRASGVDWHDVVVVATSTPALRRLLPEVAPPPRAEKWANGFYFLLRDKPQGAVEGDLRFSLGSPWSVISGFRQFEGRWYLWTAASNAKTPGSLHGRCYPECTRDELRAELLAQTAFEQPELVEDFFPGQGLEWGDGRWRNAAPLFAATLGVDEVPNRTGTPGVYVAGEFTRTTVKVATMEKANESGKRCSAAICAAFGVAYPEAKYAYDRYSSP